MYTNVDNGNIVCPNCGFVLPQGDKFCEKCGTLVQQNVPQPNPVQFPPVMSVPQTVVPQKKSKKPIVILVIVLAVILVLCAAFFALVATHVICINHQWQDATCTAPQQCEFCEKTQGNANGHQFKEATCTEPKCCEVCKETEGEALGHQWIEATCTKEKHCSKCNETTGELLEHTKVTEVEQQPTLVTTGTEKTKCSACGVVLSETVVPKKTPAVAGESFNFIGSELVDYLNDNSTLSVNQSSLKVVNEKCTTYSMTFQGERGQLILGHGTNGTLGNVCAVMVYFEDPSTSVAVIAWIGSKVDPFYSTSVAISNLFDGQTYVTENTTSINLKEDGLETYTIAPTQYMLAMPQ